MNTTKVKFPRESYRKQQKIWLDDEDSLAVANG